MSVQEGRLQKFLKFPLYIVQGTLVDRERDPFNLKRDSEELQTLQPV